MRVIVYAQDLSGRRDDGFYTKPTASAAFDIFYSDAHEIFLDEESEIILSRDDAVAIFEMDGRVIFYNADGEKVVISRDLSNEG